MKTILLALAAAALAGAAHASDDVRIDAIIRSLAPVETPAAGGPSRSEAPSVRIDPARERESEIAAPAPIVVVRQPIEIVVEERVIVVDVARAMDFRLSFPFDSARLTTEAEGELVLLAAALHSPALADATFMIAGHTDASGSAEYNEALSRRRAEAVRDFLVLRGVEPSRLVPVGLGEQRLKDPSRPTSGVNRRVEVAFVVPDLAGVRLR